MKRTIGFIFGVIFLIYSLYILFNFSKLPSKQTHEKSGNLVIAVIALAVGGSLALHCFPGRRVRNPEDLKKQKKVVDDFEMEISKVISPEDQEDLREKISKNGILTINQKAKLLVHLGFKGEYDHDFITT